MRSNAMFRWRVMMHLYCLAQVMKTSNTSLHRERQISRSERWGERLHPLPTVPGPRARVPGRSSSPCSPCSESPRPGPRPRREGTIATGLLGGRGACRREGNSPGWRTGSSMLYFVCLNILKTWKIIVQKIN